MDMTLPAKTKWAILLGIFLFISSFIGKTTLPKRNPMIISLCRLHASHSLVASKVKRAYQYLGYEIEFQYLPCGRSLFVANSGTIDGEMGRIKTAVHKFKNLLVVDYPLLEFKGVVFSHKIKSDVKSFKDLAPFRIGIIRGELYAEIGTQGMNVFPFGNYQQLLQKLKENEVDVAVGIHENFMREKKRVIFSESQINIIGKPVYESQLYHLVHKKNRDLVPRLKTAFEATNP